MAKSKLDPRIFEPDPHVAGWMKGQPMAMQIMGQAVAILLKLQGDDVWEAFLQAMQPPDTDFGNKLHGHELSRYLGQSRKSLALLFGLNAQQVDEIDAELRKRGQRVTDEPAYKTRVIEHEPSLDSQFRFPQYKGIALSSFDGLTDEQALEMLGGNTLLLECLHEARAFVASDPRRIAELKAKATPEPDQEDNIWAEGNTLTEPQPAAEPADVASQ